MTTRGQRLVFTGGQQVCLEDFDPGVPGGSEVLLKTHFSLMSTGTENIVFNRLFDPGTHWDKWVQYPFYPGYTSVGEVAAAGPEVEHLKPGQRVAYRAGHGSHALMREDACYPIPDGLRLDEAVWFALAKIAFHGALAGPYRLGDRVLVIGAGPIGQMSVRWASAAGAACVVAVDLAKPRLKLAAAGGATGVVSLPVDQARDAILEAFGGREPDIVTDSTGNAVVFAAALGLARPHGRVVLLGDTGQPSQQRLTADVITRGLTIVGAHDVHNTAEWNGASISALFFQLARTGRFPLEGLNSHVFKPADCAGAYALANRERAATMGILFDWRESR